MTPVRESGFGTGLLAHLERGRPQPEQPTVPAAPPEPEASGVTPEPWLEPASLLAERERLLAEQAAMLEEAFAELARREAALAVARETEERRPSRPLVETVQANADGAAPRVWAAFADALEAELPDGRPDHATRITAAQALLAELRNGGSNAGPPDELAQRRELREAGL